MTGLALTQLVTTPDEAAAIAALGRAQEERAAAEADLARMEQERRAMLAEQVRSTVRGVR